MTASNANGKVPAKPAKEPRSTAGRKAGKTGAKTGTKTGTKTAGKSAGKAAQTAGALRAFALGFPEAHEEFPWGERVVKVKKKVFVFLGREGDDGFGLSVKLPQSGMMALAFPFASPTGYGLGKSGWVSAQFPAGEAPPLPMLRDWISESYRAVAPKGLLARLDESQSAAAADVPRAKASQRQRR